MEKMVISDCTINYVQILAQCDISKEDLTDAIEYFRDVLQRFDLISVEAPKKFSYIVKLDIRNMKCVCGHNAFIKFLWCIKVLYFYYFYTEFHPQQCDTMAEFYNC
ncbi:uncharacterized protein LOC116851973 [Odontomachus brunneus]|uniref:uncharacterized protein LOC116851973 n=1 Tax=Odontomachus brunneus TaxID=486640 RepID=UPI0013F279F8|nr:uncharacterized protein LOC116851973 [Odontomachus brunneus]